MQILVVNCGSSSAKYQLFDVTRDVSLAKGAVERIGKDDARLTSCSLGKTAVSRVVKCRDHHAAIVLALGALTDRKRGAIGSAREIDGVGHRVVHGGEKFKASTLITAKVKASIRKYCELAPLHNPPALAGIEACSKLLKGIPQVAVFDTSFHQTMPEEAFLYGLPLHYHSRYGIRKYGFHGTSHRFVSGQAARILRQAPSELKLVTCHLGNGCSMTAVDGGKSVDTSMGFTPLEGLLMGTRSGDMDPAVVFYIMKKERASSGRISDILNKESGLLGVSGVSNDMRDILKAAKGNGKMAGRCRLAIDMFIYRIEKYIGAYTAAMGGLDAVIFTAGISENNPWLTRRIEKDLRGVVPKDTRFLVIPTDEERVIAVDTHKIIKKRR